MLREHTIIYIPLYSLQQRVYTRRLCCMVACLSVKYLKLFFMYTVLTFFCPAAKRAFMRIILRMNKRRKDESAQNIFLKNFF